MSNVLTSSLYRQGASAQTESVVSSRFKIYSNVVGQGKFYKLGVTSSFGVSESRNIETVRGLGFGDQVAELVPSVTEPQRLQITRTALYMQNIQQMLGYKAGVSGAVRSLKHHKWPFDIKTEIVFSEVASEDVNATLGTPAGVPAEGGVNNTGVPAGGLFCVATLFVGCWMNDYSTSYAIDTAMVNEECSITCTDVFDVSGTVYGEFIDSGNNAQDATGRSLIYNENNPLVQTGSSNAYSGK
jgi:hypothetical protein